MESDLARRDFSINALALPLTSTGPAPQTALLDPFNGQADLAEGVLRVLHPASLRDDPTRIFRAARFAARYRFQADADTERLIPAALPHVAALSGERVRHELMLIFAESVPEQALAWLAARQVLHHLQIGLTFSEKTYLAFAQARAIAFSALASPPSTGLDPLVYWAILAASPANNTGQLAAGPTRLQLDRATALIWQMAPALPQLVADLEGVSVPSACVERLEQFRKTDRPSPTVWESLVIAALALAPAGGVASANLISYAKRWQHVYPTLSGDALKGLGVPASPQMAKLLWQLRAARLDGVIDTVDAEQRMVLDWLKNGFRT
jgi:tRNA nucleotidyltransferase (CCA-adding enzyme)